MPIIFVQQTSDNGLTWIDLSVHSNIADAERQLAFFIDTQGFTSNTLRIYNILSGI